MMKENTKKNKKKKIIRTIISIVSILGFLLCTVALLYPVISDRWNRYRDMKLITEYNRQVNVSGKDYDAIMEEVQKYNTYLRQQHRNIVTDAEYEPDDYYESLLNITGNGMIGYIEIPCIDVTEPIYHYSIESSLKKGIGHIHGSSLPVGGTSTHSVLTGHRGLPNQKFFSDLDKLDEGDKFYVHILGQVLAYEVYNIDSILPTDVDALMIEDGKDLCTLVTCTPYGVNTHRLLVMGKRVPFNQENVSGGLVTTEEHKMVIDPAVWVAIGFASFITLLVIITIISKIIRMIKKKKKAQTKGGATS